MYRWELDDLALPAFEALDTTAQALLTAFMDAVVIVDRSTISVTSENVPIRPRPCAHCISADITRGLLLSWCIPPMNWCLSSGSSG